MLKFAIHYLAYEIWATPSRIQLTSTPGDGSDGVNIEEFVQGCYRLSGEAITLHTQALPGRRGREVGG